MRLETAQLIHKIKADHDDKIRRLEYRLDMYEKIVFKLEDKVRRLEGWK